MSNQIDHPPTDAFARNIEPVVDSVLGKALEAAAMLAEKRADCYALTGKPYHAHALRTFAAELRDMRREHLAGAVAEAGQR